jgi:acyl-homoserine lactone acylase PvdQ
MIVFGPVVAAGAGSIGAVSCDLPFILSLWSRDHGQDDPERVEKDLIHDKVFGASLRPVGVPRLAEPVEILRDRLGIHGSYARNENDLFVVLGYTAARDQLFQIEIRQATGTLAGILGRRSAFVRRRTIDRRNRHVVEPEIHAQLAAMMDDVMQHEAAER